MRAAFLGCILHPLTACAALAQAPAGETDEVGLGAALIMAAFLLIAWLAVVSVLCKVLLATGLVPGNPKSRLHRTIVWLAGVVGSVRTVPNRRDQRRGRS